MLIVLCGLVVVVFIWMIVELLVWLVIVIGFLGILILVMCKVFVFCR